MIKSDRFPGVESAVCTAKVAPTTWIQESRTACLAMLRLVGAERKGNESCQSIKDQVESRL